MILARVLNGLGELGYHQGESLIREVERDFVEADSILDNNKRGLTSATLFRKSQQMWTIPQDSTQFFPGRSKEQAGSTRLEWKDLASRFFESVYDPYWESEEHSNKVNKTKSGEIRVESKDIKLPDQIEQHVQSMIYETDTGDKWGKLRKGLLKEYVPTH